jgi:hypothetical protein
VVEDPPFMQGFPSKPFVHTAILQFAPYHSFKHEHPHAPFNVVAVPPLMQGLPSNPLAQF